ncbi:LTA synthase family protein [Rhodopirellula sp. JC740]|uniref:LTA synthase family protein n=1 Tax=Rhodopirellula halodulae TaxID=2894198 RepID=A0ABS8NJ23_9BACT|nr:sulfatase-like hydrolase/transferase [Rhodopirellula sp. JC740]MCC9643545.1 LTA synthase family protein [Rhodopirellula sp. JC740]
MNGRAKYRRFQQSLLHSLLNALLIACFALFHQFSPDADLRSQLSYSGVVCLAILEATLLLVPGIFAGYLLNRFQFGWAYRATYLWTLFVSGIYFIDFSLLIFLKEHLLSPTFANLLVAVGPFLHQYITLPTVAITAGLLALWLLTQWALLIIAGRFSSTDESDKKQLDRKSAFILCGVAAIPIVAALTPAVIHWQRTLTEIDSASDRHPVTLLGFWSASKAPRLQTKSEAAVQGSVVMLSNASVPMQIVERYNQLELNWNSATQELDTQPPDIVIVVSECFRGDLVTAKTTPFLYRKSKQGLFLKNHISSGNASNLGFFGILFGLDAHMFEHASEMPVGMMQGFEQLGYETGFFGRAGFDTFSMETFCSADRFNNCVFTPIQDSVQPDLQAVSEAKLFLDREQQYATDESKPRIAIVYIYSPHDWYHEPQDDIHNIKDVPASFRSVSRSRNDFRRFLNSVHFMDRVIEPLFTDSRIGFVTGDHGESFGEDGRIMHGTALSKVQTHVGCIGFGPNIPAKEIDHWTSHVDLLPTLLDSIGATASDSSLLSGNSLLQTVPEDRVVSCRSIGSANHLFLSTHTPLNSFGYLGFFDWNHFTLAPGQWVDNDGESIHSATQPNNWGTAATFRRWLVNDVSKGFDDLDSAPLDLLAKTLQSDDRRVLLESIKVLRLLPGASDRFHGDLQGLLASPYPEVRKSAFELLHTIARESSS